MISWLPITEYSSKYKVSASTLRRRIRAERTEHIYEDGKYLLKDAPLIDHHPNNQQDSRKVEAPPQHLDDSAFELPVSNEYLSGEASDKNELPKIEPSESHVYDEAVAKILHELKKAYSLVLQEKEEQVMILKDEVADLHTLVKVLESENDRIRALYEKNVPRESSIRTPSVVEENRHEMDPASLLKDGEWVHDLEIE